MYDNKLCFYTKTLDGHRADYFRFITLQLGGNRIAGKNVFSSKKIIFFLMIEDSFLFYFVASLFRSLTNKKTIGLLFRPKPALEGKALRLIIKRWMLIFLKKNNKIKTLSIVPYWALPKAEKITDDWIYDLQLWDLSNNEVEIFLKHSLEVGKHKKGESTASFIINDLSKIISNKKVIGAIGRQDKSKGFDSFYNFSKSESASDFYFASAGKIAEDCKENLYDLNGSINYIIDRYISNLEIIKIYAECDFIWCYYSKDYDQASGILGRSIQLGVPVIVRQGSISNKICEKYNINHIVINETMKLKYFLDKKSPEERLKLAQILVNDLKSLSIGKINKFLVAGI